MRSQRIGHDLVTEQQQELCDGFTIEFPAARVSHAVWERLKAKEEGAADDEMVRQHH